MTEGAAAMSVQPGGSTMEVLEQHCRLLEGELSTLRESEARLRQQHSESQRRERVLVRRLATKEQEMQDLVNQVAELKASQNPGAAALRSSLLDPAVNIILQKLKSELQATKARLEETQNELSAWKFTPDSNTGKRLMAKCRLLYQENEELGKMTSNGRLAKLEGDLALKKSFSDEVKKSQSELDDFLQELDEDVEGMQSTIYFLQKELLNTKETMTSLERENQQLSAKINGQKESTTPKLLNGDAIKIQKCEKLANVPANETRVKSSPKWKNNCESSDSEPELIIKVSENEIICDESQDEKTEDKNCERRTKGSDKLLIKENGIVDNNIENRTALTSSVSNSKKDSSFKSIKRNYDSDSSDSSMKVNERTSKSVKKVRRSSVLSLDYNDDTENEDALVISTNGDANISDVE